MKFGHCIRLSEYAACAELGYDFAELCGTELIALDDVSFSDLCKTVKGGPIPCTAINMYSDERLAMIGPAFKVGDARDYAQKMMACAAKLGVQTVGIGSPKSRILPDGYSRPAADEQMLSFLRVTCEAALAFGITVLLEPVNHTLCNYLNKTEEVVAMVSRADLKNLGYMMDICHMVPEGESLREKIPELAGAAHFHIGHCDISGRRSTLTDADAALLKEIGACMKLANYQGCISVEAGGPNFRQHAAISLQAMKKCL